MNATQSLWGELPVVDAIRLPVIILREQATKLTELTNGLLQGEVTTRKVHDELRHNLLIVAPALDNYSFNVLSTRHGVIAYPVIINSFATQKEYNSSNEKEFVEAIANILSSAEVHKTLGALLAQSKAEE